MRPAPTKATPAPEVATAAGHSAAMRSSSARRVQARPSGDVNTAPLDSTIGPPTATVPTATNPPGTVASPVIAPWP